MNFENEDTFEEMNERLDKLIEDRVAAERERCAKIAEAAPGEYTPHMEMGWPTNHPIRCEFAVRIANKIRSGE